MTGRLRVPWLGPRGEGWVPIYGGLLLLCLAWSLATGPWACRRPARSPPCCC